MAKGEQTRIKRKAHLGVNFDIGTSNAGAVVVYIGAEEIVVAYLPEDAAITCKQATLLAMKFKELQVPLTEKQSAKILGISIPKIKRIADSIPAVASNKTPTPLV